MEKYRKALEQEKRRDGNIGQPISGPVQHALANEMLYLAGRRNEMTAEGVSLEAFEQIQERHGLHCRGGHWRYWTHWEKDQMEKPEGIPSPVYPRSAKCWNGIDTLWRLNKRHQYKSRWPEIESVEKIRTQAESSIMKAKSREERQYYSAKEHFARDILLSFGGMWNGNAMPPGHLRNHVLATQEMVKSVYDYLSPEYRDGMIRFFTENKDIFLTLADALDVVQEEQLTAWRATGWGWQGEKDHEEKVKPAVKTPRLQEVISHIENTRNKWTRAENPGHHQRWDLVEELIRDGLIDEAIDYATEHAQKGWKPWEDVVKMLENP